MTAPHRWSLLVPAGAVVVSVALLPVAASPLVPDTVKDPLSYLVVWIPLVVAVVVSLRLATRRRAERWWRALRLPLGVMGAIVGIFVGLVARTVAVGIELAATGRIAAGLPISEGGASFPVAAAAVVLASVIVAPVIEESFFRGTSIPAVAERIGRGRTGDAVAIVLVALAFAVLHGVAGASVVASVVTFVAGIGFGLVSRSNGTGSAIVAHAVFNGSGVVLAMSADGLSPLYPTLALG